MSAVVRICRESGDGEDKKYNFCVGFNFVQCMRHLHIQT